MQGLTVGFLGNLLAAAEAVGDDQPVGGRLADSWQKFELPDSFRHVVFLFFEAESSRHAAASGCWSGEIDPHPAQDRFFRGHLHDRFVMAVTVNESLACDFRERK